MSAIYTYTVTFNGKAIAKYDTMTDNVEKLKKELKKIYPSPCKVEIKPGFKNGMFSATPRF